MGLSWRVSVSVASKGILSVQGLKIGDTELKRPD